MHEPGEEELQQKTPGRVRDSLVRARIARARETLDEVEALAFERLAALWRPPAE